MCLCLVGDQLSHTIAIAVTTLGFTGWLSKWTAPLVQGGAWVNPSLSQYMEEGILLYVSIAIATLHVHVHGS